MKRLFLKFAALPLLLLAACEKESVTEKQLSDIVITDIGCLTDNVTIGSKLENPYGLH